MMCKTGCGVEVRRGETFDVVCAKAWLMSPEFARFANHLSGERRAASKVAVVDFCTRLRAERLNGGKS